MKTRLLAGLFAAMICGCSGQLAVTTENPNTSMDHPVPNRAAEFDNLGSGWYTFKLFVGGRTRTFLVHRKTFGYEGTEAVVELRD